MARSSIHAVSAGICLLLLAGVTAQAHEVKCGGTITEDVVLKGDLHCKLSPGGPGLTVEGPATLDLGGFTIRCEGKSGDSCVALMGAQATLRSGRVRIGEREESEGLQAPAVRIGGRGGHTVQGIEAHAGTELFGTNHTSFVVESNGNHLQGNTAIGEMLSFVVEGNTNFLVDNISAYSSDGSFVIHGANNRLRNNIIASSESASIFVRGPHNIVIENQIGDAKYEEGIFVSTGADFTTVNGNILTDGLGSGGDGESLDGIDIHSNHNMISSNVVRDFGRPSGLFDGITLYEGATDNVVTGNQVSGAVTDLVDKNRECADNVWIANVYETANRPCVEFHTRR